MALTLRAFVADTLRTASPAADWNAAGVDRADELAGMLIRSGINDLTHLGLQVVAAVSTEPHYETVEDERAGHGVMREEWTEAPRDIQALVFVYESRQIGYLGTPNKKAANQWTQPNVFDGLEFAWSAAGHGHVSYLIEIRGKEFALVPKWASSSEAGVWRNAVKTAVTFYGMIGLAIAGSAIASQIGTAILGPSLSASYPGLATAVGQTAMNTALNGGDVEQAAKDAAINSLGAQYGEAVGMTVANATDLVILGKLASAVTSAAIRGGDIERAAALTLARNVGDTLQIFETPAKGDDMKFGDFSDFANFDAGTTGDPYVYDMAPMPAPMPAFDYSGGYFGDSQPAIAPLTFESNFDIANSGAYFGNDAFLPGVTALPAFDYSGGNFGKAEAPLPPEPVETWSWANARNVINQASQTVLTAVTAVAALNKVANPKINPNAQNVAADGTVTRALDTGIVQTRLPDGRVVNARPPKDVAQSTVSGNVIVNNGDGTYTLISPDGRQRIIQYGADTGSALADLPWSYIGGGLAALLLLPKILK